MAITCKNNFSDCLLVKTGVHSHTYVRTPPREIETSFTHSLMPDFHLGFIGIYVTNSSDNKGTLHNVIRESVDLCTWMAQMCNICNT